LRKEFGYGLGSNISGTYSVRLLGDEERVESVQFFIDDREIAKVLESPFKTEFQTDDFGFGWHDIYAEVAVVNGSVMKTGTLRYKFLSPEEEKSGIRGVLLPVGVVLIAAMGISVLIQMLGKKKESPADPTRPRNYGPLGGTICPKCGHPFPRSLLGMNLVVGRLERCESCKKFVMTRRATPAELVAAEAAERAVNQPDMTITKEIQEEREIPRDSLEDSKYIDQL
jgi:hypothetical protein